MSSEGESSNDKETTVNQQDGNPDQAPDSIQSLEADPVQSSGSPGPVQPPKSPGPVQPPESTGPVQPPESTDPVQPSESPGPVQPPVSTGSVQPSVSTDSVQPPESPVFEGNKTNLIVNYLPQTMTDDEFINLFSAIGTITNHKVVRDLNSGYCFGYGFVEYGSEEDAKSAIIKLNGLQLRNKTLKVAYARPKSAKTKNCTLYITALPPSTTNESLKEMFSPFGTVINSKVLTNMATKECNGVGFILFASTDECEKAMEALNNTIPEGGTQELVIKFASNNVSKKQNFVPGTAQSFAGPMRGGRNQMGRVNPMARPEPGIMCDPTLAQRTSLGVVIFVRGLSQEVDDEELYSIFCPFGTVRKVSVMKTMDGTSKGFGFVTMAEDQEAVRAVLKLNNSKYKERVLEVRFKEAKGQGMGQGMMNQNMMMMNQNMMNQNMMNQNMMGGGMMGNHGMMGFQGGMMGYQGGMMGNQGGMMMANQPGMMGNQGVMMGNQGGMMANQGGMMEYQGDTMSHQGGHAQDPYEAEMSPPVERRRPPRRLPPPRMDPYAHEEMLPPRSPYGMRRRAYVEPAPYEYDYEYY